MHVVVFWKSVFVSFFADALCEDVIFSDIGIDGTVTFQHSMGGNQEQLYRHDLSCGPVRYTVVDFYSRLIEAAEASEWLCSFVWPSGTVFKLSL